MTLEEAKQDALLAAAKAQALQAVTKPPQNEALQFASGFNKSLIGATGFFGDIVDKGRGLTGLGPDRPFGAVTERLTDVAQDAGLLKPKGTPETPGERAGQITAASVLAAAPVAKAGQGIKAGKSIFEPIIKTFREAPKTFAAIEGTSTVAAIVGGEAARGVCPEGVPESSCAILAKNIFKQLPFVGKKTSTLEAAELLQDFAGDTKKILSQAGDFDALSGTQFTFAELDGKKT